jgi:hypothetical protein
MLRWISTIGTLAALIACKGLLVFFSVMSALGVSMTLDGTIWVNLILVLVTLALVGFVINLRKHENALPILLALVGAGAIYYSYLVEFVRPIETAGIIILVLAAALDIWALRSKSSALANVGQK